MYLYSAALGVVVGLKESRRHGAGLESPRVEDMHDPDTYFGEFPFHARE
jgi:hypothetical protein